MQTEARDTKVQDRHDGQDHTQTSRYLSENRPATPGADSQTVIEPQPEPLTEPQVGRRGDKTMRTKPLAMKVTPAFHKKLKIYAVEYEIDMVDIIEDAVALWISQLDADKTRKH